MASSPLGSAMPATSCAIASAALRVSPSDQSG